MDGSAKYELLQKIAGDKVIAFRGRQREGGHIVLLHQLTTGNDHSDVLGMAIQYLLRNPASAGGRILDLVEIQGARYIVTVDQPECLALREWLKWELEGAKPTPAPTPAAPVREPGEFTRLFQQPAAAPAAKLPSPPTPVPPPPLAPPPPTERPAPGEFTQLFGNAGPRQPSEAPPSPVMPSPVAPPPPAAEKHQPGEFTRLFRGPLDTPSEVPSHQLPTPAPAPSSRAAGEFTRIFGGMGSQPASPPPAAPSPVAPSPAPVSSGGPLTESLEPRQAPGVRQDTPPPSAGPGEFTRVILGSAGAAAPSPSVPAAASPSAAAPVPSIAMSAAPTPPAMPQPPAVHVAAPPPVAPPPLPKAPAMPAMSMPAPAAPAPAAQGQSGSQRPTPVLFIMFVVLLVAALALIAIAVLRR